MSKPGKLDSPGQLNVHTLVAIPGSNSIKRPLYLHKRKDLLESEDVQIIDEVDKCPNIYVKIQGIKTKALIDTGSEITCISEYFFEDNKRKFKNCKILPIVGTSVVGATGVKPVKLKHQLYADLNINDETYSCVFIVIPKLNKDCVLGIDLLTRFKGRINIELKIEFIDDKEKSIRLIHELNMELHEELINVDAQDFVNGVNYPDNYEEFKNIKEYNEFDEKYCITDAEIKKKWQNASCSTAKRRNSGRF